MIIDRIIDYTFQPVFARVSELLDVRVDLLLKLEGFNPGGSIKLKPAIALVTDLRRRGLLNADSVLIDTTSGNMGISLALLARSLGYGFTCVTDEKITPHNSRLIQAYGGDIVILERSTLRERYDYIRRRIAEDGRFVWTQQFENSVNPAAHETTTAREILLSLPRVDHLFVGIGTGGTLAGCAKVFAAESPWTRITAVDAEGSAHFGNVACAPPRRIPGIGASERSRFIDDSRIHDAIVVPEESALEHCALLLRRTGWLLGGSSGSVLSAITSSASQFEPGAVVVGICADFGERYLDGVYGGGFAQHQGLKAGTTW